MTAFVHRRARARVWISETAANKHYVEQARRAFLRRVECAGPGTAIAQPRVMNTYGSTGVRVHNHARQLSLFSGTHRLRRPRLFRPGNISRPRLPLVRVLCTGCRAKEARYGFRDTNLLERPSTLCFECFQRELERRQRAVSRDAERVTCGQDAVAARLDELSRRRRRVQIAARRALGPEWP